MPPLASRSSRLFFRGVKVNSRVAIMDEMVRRGHDFGGSQDAVFKSLKQQCREFRYLVYMGG